MTSESDTARFPNAAEYEELKGLADRLAQKSRDRFDAAELLNQSLVRIYELPHVSEIRSLIGYTKHVMFNLSKTLGTSNKAAVADLQNQPQPPPRPEDERLGLLQRCLELLTDRVRQALRWKYLEGEQHSAIADRLGMTLEAVKQMMSRAQRSLKACIELELQLDAGGML